jgi:23S rRNA maturation-related 3'-5' exoribonuclease YhaM
MKEQYKKEIEELLNSCIRQNINSIINYLNMNGYYSCPASSKFHGSKESGLVEHCLKVYKVFDTLCGLYYPQFPRESRIIISLLHDVCKLNNYSKQTDGTYKKIDDDVFGHGSKSVEIIKRHIPLTIVEENIIKFHMNYYGSVEFSKYGEYGLKLLTDKIDKNKLIILFHYADNIATKFLENES